MPALVHNSFRISNAKQFKESFQELAEFGIGKFVPTNISSMTKNTTTGEWDVNTGTLTAAELDQIPSSALDDQIYLFIGRVTPWTSTDTPDGTPDPTIDENNPPDPVDSVKHGNFDHWDDMIAAKKVRGSDVSHVVKRERPNEIKSGYRGWVSANPKRYHEYDDRSAGLFDDDMMHHTINERFRVYKCMKRGIGRFANTGDTLLAQSGWVWDHLSYVEPSTNIQTGGISDDYMVDDVDGQRGDGYQWKFLYTIAAGEALKFVTTSYIPVRTIRKADGSRKNDYSDQWSVEENAMDGAILNVLVKKTPVMQSSNTAGYEPEGGNGYLQMRADLPSVAWGPANTMTVTFAGGGSINPCSFPGAAGGAPGANNRFDFSLAGNANSVASNTHPTLNLEGYGVIFDGLFEFATNGVFPDAHKYVYPVSGHAYSSGNVTLTIDPAFVGALATGGVLPTGIATSSFVDTSNTIPIEVHPKIDVTANYTSTTGQGVVDSFQAYGVVEPFFLSSEQYNETELGRMIDVVVKNPGKGHTRVDATTISPDVTGNAVPAVVHACVSPVGGHGFDPVAELGGYNVMINARFEGSEDESFSVGNEFRKIGILKNPMTWQANNLWMESGTYADRFGSEKGDQCYKLRLANNSFDAANTAVELPFQSDMRVNFYANTGSSYDNTVVIASATVVDYRTDVKEMRLIKPRGDWAAVWPDPTNLNTDYMIESASPHSVTANNVQALTLGGTYFTPAMKPGSGDILYLENRTTVSRSANQSEDLKVSIQF